MNEKIARAGARLLDDAGGVGSAADVSKKSGKPLANVRRYLHEAEKAGLVRGYPGVGREGIVYHVGGRR